MRKVRSGESLPKDGVMRAVIFERAGQPEDVLAVGEIPLPVPSSAQVLIKVAARTIQPADFLFIEGRYRLKPQFPQPAGFEGVGVVVACGEGVADVETGARVAFRSPGAWAEYVAVHRSRIYPVPDGVADDVASQFALNPLAAWGLLATSELEESSRILLTAGRSVVANLLGGLAQRHGIKAFKLVRHDGGYSVLDGATDTALATGPTIAETLRDTGLSFHAIFDAVGGPAVSDLIDVLEPGGRLISYGLLDDGEITIRASRILYKNMIWQGFGIDAWLNKNAPEQLAVAQRELWDFLTTHSELQPVVGRFPLSDFRAAIAAARAAPRPGKVLLVG